MPSPATLGTNPSVLDGVEVFDRLTTAKSVASQESGSVPPPAATNRRGGANPAAAAAVTAEGAPMSDAGVVMGRSDSSGGGGAAAPGAAVESAAGTAGEQAVQRQVNTGRAAQFGEVAHHDVHPLFTCSMHTARRGFPVDCCCCCAIPIGCCARVGRLGVTQCCLFVG